MITCLCSPLRKRVTSLDDPGKRMGRITNKVTVSIFERDRGIAGPWGSLSESPHPKKVHRTSNAPLAVNRGQMQAERLTAAKAVVFWGCAGLNFKAKLPSHEMI